MKSHESTNLWICRKTLFIVGLIGISCTKIYVDLCIVLIGSLYWNYISFRYLLLYNKKDKRKLIYATKMEIGFEEMFGFMVLY